MDKQFIVYFLEGAAAAFRNAVLAETHSHHAVQITLDFDGEFEIFHNNRSEYFKCAIIPNNLSHRLDASGHWQLTVLLDPELILTKKLVQHMNLKKAPLALPEAFVSDLLSLFSFSRDNTPPSLSFFKEHFYTALWSLVGEVESAETDDRIANLLVNIHGLDDLSDVDELLNEIPLSKSRISHLFVEQTGIPMRSYLVWLKVRRAVDYMLANHSITDSAHLAGFSDLAHLSRSFKKMFGMNVSLLFQTKDFIHLETDV